jgi:uncharacterized membrane protein YhaH (DUF805 family)
LNLLSPQGRLAPRAFTIAVIGLYIAVFCSQALLGGGVTGAFGFWPFMLVQAALAWVWFILHAKRLHDAGRTAGHAAAIAVLYMLGMVLLMLVVMLIISADPGQGANGSASGGGTGSEVGGVVRVFVLLGMVALLFGNAGLGEFGYLLLGFMGLVMAPIVVAIVYSIWAGTRPTASS